MSVFKLPTDLAGREVAVLFSGGRDSTLVACLLALKGVKLHLLTGSCGLGIGTEIVETRFQELSRKFSGNIVAWKTLDIKGLLGAIAFRNIENDFREHQTNLILLGEKMALHTEAILYCLSMGIKYIADGTTKYQAHLAEQAPEAVTFFCEFSEEYGIQYLTPVYEAASEQQVKDHLFILGISTKSLESISLLSDSFSKPSEGVSALYLAQKKPICAQYIAFKRGEISNLNALGSPE